MLQTLVSFLLMVISVSPVFAASKHCSEPNFAELQKSVVGLNMDVRAGMVTSCRVNVLGTAWFMTPTKLVTVGHVTDPVFNKGWKEISIYYSDTLNEPASTKVVRKARLVEVIAAEGYPDPISVIEIDQAIEGSKVAMIRERPLTLGEAVFGIGYRGPNAILQYAVGVVRGWEIPEGLDWNGPKKGVALELSGVNQDDRLVFSNGTSGSPIFDCKGRVVALNSMVIYTMDLVSGSTEKGGGSCGPKKVKKPVDEGRINNIAVPSPFLLKHR